MAAPTLRGDGLLLEDSGTLDVAQVCQYTQISTAGTTTIKSTVGLFFGVFAPRNGTGTTSTSYYVLDGTTTLAGTNTVTSNNQAFNPFGGGNGIRTQTNLIVVTAGTGVLVNVLWD